MPDNNPVTKAHQVSVTSIETGNREGTSTVTVGGLGQFPTKLSNVYDSLLEGVVVGGTYTFHLERGSRKQNYEGKEGDQDWMYFQNVRTGQRSTWRTTARPVLHERCQDHVPEYVW